MASHTAERKRLEKETEMANTIFFSAIWDYYIENRKVDGTETDHQQARSEEKTELRETHIKYNIIKKNIQTIKAKCTIFFSSTTLLFEMPISFTLALPLLRVRVRIIYLLYKWLHKRIHMKITRIYIPIS